MGASISKDESQRHSYGKTMKRSGKGKSMRKRTMKRRTKRTKRTMKKQRGGYVYSGTRQHRSTALARGVSLNRPKSHKKNKSRKNKSRKSRK